MSNFWEDVMPGGYYDEVLISGIKAGRGIQPNWHNITFLEVRKYVEEGLIHLDYACGPGTFIGNYLFNSSLGVDISNEQIKYANKHYGNKARFFNLEEYENSEIIPESVDVITVLGLFEFISNQEIKTLMNKFFDILKPGGKIVITTLNYGSNMKYLIKLVNMFGTVGYGQEHTNKLHEDTLQKLLLETRFNKIEIKQFINFGVFFSFISISFGIRMNEFIRKYIFRKKGYLLIGVIEK